MLHGPKSPFHKKLTT